MDYHAIILLTNIAQIEKHQASNPYRFRALVSQVLQSFLVISLEMNQAMVVLRGETRVLGV